MGEDGGTGERRYFLESRKYQRTCVVNGKAAGFKLGVALATCRPAPARPVRRKTEGFVRDEYDTVILADLVKCTV